MLDAASNVLRASPSMPRDAAYLMFDIYDTPPMPSFTVAVKAQAILQILREEATPLALSPRLTGTLSPARAHGVGRGARSLFDDTANLMRMPPAR